MLQDVRLELMKEDVVAAAEGAVSPHKVSITSFLVMGLDIKDQQYVTDFFLCPFYHLNK